MSSDPNFGAEEPQWAQSAPQETATDEKVQQRSFLDSPSDGHRSNQEKAAMESTSPIPPPYDDIEDNDHKEAAHADTAEDLVTNVLHVDDDPTQNPWTVRMVFLGMCSFARMKHG